MLDINTIKIFGNPQNQLDQNFLNSFEVNTNINGFIAGLNILNLLVQSNRKRDLGNNIFNKNLDGIFDFLKENPGLKNYIQTCIKNIAKKAILSIKDPDLIDIKDNNFIGYCSNLGISIFELGKLKIDLANQRKKEIERKNLEIKKQQEARALAEKKKREEIKNKHIGIVVNEVKNIENRIKEFYRGNGLNFDKIVSYAFINAKKDIEKVLESEQAKLDEYNKTDSGKYKVAILSEGIRLPGREITGVDCNTKSKVTIYETKESMGMYVNNHLRDGFVEHLTQKDCFSRVNKINEIIKIISNNSELCYIKNKFNDDNFCKKLVEIAFSLEGREDVVKDIKDAYLNSSYKSKYGDSPIYRQLR